MTLPVQGTPVPEANRVLRYCKPSTLKSDGSPDVGSYVRRAKETYLSVNDADLAAGSSLHEKASSTKTLMSPWLVLRPTGLLAASATQAVQGIEVQPNLQVLYEPIAADATRPANPFHCGIHGVPTEEDVARGQLSVLISIASTVTEFWTIDSL